MSSNLQVGWQGIIAHPDSPAGGCGPGRFRIAGPLGSEMPLFPLSDPLEFDSYEDEEEEGHASDDVDPDDKKKTGTARRKWWIRRGNFVGNSLNRLLGRPQPKYFHRRWSSHKAEPKYEYETVVIGQKIVSVEKSDTTDLRIEHDPAKGFTGNAFYKRGDPKTPTFPFGSPNEGLLFAEPDAPTAPKGGKFIDATTTTTVTGNLKFSFGDQGDTQLVGGMGRIRINAVDPAGTSTIVYDSGWITTLGTVTTVALPNPPGNRTYTVVIGVEEWWAGHTEYMYVLQLKQQTKTVTRFAVDIKKKIKVKT